MHRYAPTIDLVLLSHGDLAHSGLYAFAWSRWGLRAPTYTTLPVQAMARISALEDVENIRAQENVDGLPNSPDEPEGNAETPNLAESGISSKYVATTKEVQDAFDSVNTLRFSQPTHLQGLVMFQH